MYANDKVIAKDTEFMAWIGQLEDVLKEWGRKHGEVPYGLPLSESTGLSCWYDSFRDDMTPQEAFDSDRSYWEAA